MSGSTSAANSPAKRLLSLGKRRALQRASTPQGVFTILAIDHQDALRRVLRPDNPLAVSDADMTAFKLDVVEALRPAISGTLLDPIYSAAQAIQVGLVGSIGLLVELEKSGYQMQPLPLDVEVDPTWSVAKIKRMGADGVKLFFYYHPDNPNHAARQETVVRQIVADCAVYDLPFYAEPIAYPLNNGETGREAMARDLPHIVAESARRIAALGVDVLKLEFPVDARYQPDEAAWVEVCQRLTAALDIPWAVLSAGVAFETFCRQVEAACQAGASGFIAGRAVWGDACQITERQQRRAWLREEGRRRMERLAEIAARRARPWTEWFDAPTVTTGWFKNYPGL